MTQNQPSGLELKIPPVLLVIISALLMLATRLIAPPFPIPAALRIGLPILCLIPAAIIGLGAVRSFVRAKTTVNPIRPDDASTLVTSGIYAISRNPMYTALAFALLALAIWLANGLALLILPAFILYMTRFQILPEERALTHLFGPEYKAYQQQTRRWL